MPTDNYSDVGGAMESCKIYVDVDATFTKDGRLLPKSFIWTDGHRYEIQRIKHICRAASLKAGGSWYKVHLHNRWQGKSSVL